MPRELVDHAPFAIDRERHLGFDGPAVVSQHECGEFLAEHRVTPAQEAVHLAASPTSDQIDTDIQGRRDAPDPAQRQVLAMPPFNERHRGVRDTGKARQVCLGQAGYVEIDQPFFPFSR